MWRQVCHSRRRIANRAATVRASDTLQLTSTPKPTANARRRGALRTQRRRWIELDRGFNNACLDTAAPGLSVARC